MKILLKNAPHQKWHIYTDNSEWSLCSRQYFCSTNDTWKVNLGEINQDNLCKKCLKSYLSKGIT